MRAKQTLTFSVNARTFFRSREPHNRSTRGRFLCCAHPSSAEASIEAGIMIGAEKQNVWAQRRREAASFRTRISCKKQETAPSWAVFQDFADIAMDKKKVSIGKSRIVNEKVNGGQEIKSRGKIRKLTVLTHKRHAWLD